MLNVRSVDVERMRAALFFEGPARRQRASRFWVLLVLAALIATAGVIADSTATVIGAMIVAPLMTPILGIVLAVTLGDRTNLIRSVAFVVGGAILVVIISWLLGKFVAVDVDAASNLQVAGRVSPRTIDLVAALATGLVGSFALARRDVSDTLPGVAIAISLVPPLAVTGLTLEAGRTDQARGSLLLFLTNVAAILLTGVVVMALYRVRGAATTMAIPEGTRPPRSPVVVIVALVVLVAIPLVAAGRRYTQSTLTTDRVATAAEKWADNADWRVISVTYRDGTVLVRASGPQPRPDPAELRRMLDADGEAKTAVTVELVPEERFELPGR